MAVNALVAAETFYLLSISQFVPQCLPTGVIKLNRLAMHIGIICVVILQVVFTVEPHESVIWHGTTKFCSSSNLHCRRLTYYFVALLLKRFAPMK